MAMEDLLRRLGMDLGVPLEFDADGRCMLVCNDGLRIELAIVAGGSALLFTAPLSDSALAPSPELYVAALRYATNMERGGGAAVTLDPRDAGLLRLQHLKSIEQLYDNVFRAVLSDFMAEARRARQVFGQQLPSGPDATPVPAKGQETYTPSQFDLRI